MFHNDLDINSLSEQELSAMIADGKVSVSNQLTWIDIIKECDRFFWTLGQATSHAASPKPEMISGLRQSATQIYIDAQNVITSLKKQTEPQIQN